MKVMMFGVEFGEQTHVHCSRYLNLLRLAGCDVIFVGYPGIKPPEFPDVTYRRYPRRYRSFEKLLGTQTAYFLRKQSMRLLWRYVRPDICHVQWLDENFWHAARSGLRPLVATAWGSDIYETAELSDDDPQRHKVAAALRLVDHLIVDSEDLAAAAEELAGTKLNTTLLPIGIDTAQFRPGLLQKRKEWRERLRIDPHAIVLISPRRLGANYRQSEIIRAFAALDRTACKQTYLIIRTFDRTSGPTIRQLRELTDRLNVSGQVRWVGDVDYAQLPGLYAASDIAINLTFTDGFPVTFIECLGCGLQVVSNRLSSYEANGVSAYLVFAEDDTVSGLKAATEAAIARLAQSRPTAEARDYVARNLDERVTARALRQVYEKVLAGTAPGGSNNFASYRSRHEYRLFTKSGRSRGDQVEAPPPIFSGIGNPDDGARSQDFS